MLRLIPFILLLLLLTQTSYASKDSKQKTQVKPGSLVQTAPVNNGSLIAYQSFIGTLYYSEISVVASQVAGLALKVNFESTDQVKKNQLLVELDHEILDSKKHALKASINEIRLQLEKVNKDLKRYTQLLKQKNVSQQQFDEIYYNKTALEQKLIALQAQLDILNIERRQSLIRAPFNGVITKKEISRGEWVDKGGKIATLVNPDEIYVLFDIPAGFANNLTFNKTIEVKINQKNYPASIQGLIIQGDSKTRTLPLKVKLDKGDKSLFGGLEAEIKLPRKSQSNSLLLPRDAVIKRFGQDIVFTIKEGKAQMIPVQVTLYQGTQAAVTAQGLTSSMRVITKGNERIFPDQAVRENQP
jgi:membrane fusion protein, multidrug efflux system